MLQRVRIPGGRLTGGQWTAIGQAAKHFAPNTPLHLTTRQDIEFHDLVPGQIPALQQLLDRIGLTCFGAAGDTFRNITVCPCSGAAAGTVDLMPLAVQIRDTLREVDGICSLPWKFKISLSCSPECGQPWINDLGLVARERDGQWGFRVTAGGSLGAMPGTGTLLYEWMAADDVLPLAVATVSVFAAYGNRENRRKARLRHVRERMGDEPFAGLLLGAFETTRCERRWAAANIPPNRGRLETRTTLTFANGDVTAAMAESLGWIADKPGFAVRIANQHCVMLFGPDAAALGDVLAKAEPLLQPSKTQPGVVACPGKRWCGHALVHTNELANRIRAELGRRIPRGATVCVSGCPNGCAHSAVADIGLIGGRSTRDGRQCEVFTLLIGGDMGRSGRLARTVAAKLDADQVVREISKLLAEKQLEKRDD